MLKSKFILAVFSLPIIAACSPQPTMQMQSANVYRSSETQSAMRVSDCRVSQARYVSIVGDSAQDRNRATASQVVGGVAGALIGRAVGSEIGRGEGNKLARDLGTLAGGVAGANIGENINAQRLNRTGVEYTVDLGVNGYRTIVQNLNPGEAPLQPGMACRLSGNSSTVRVLPG